MFCITLYHLKRRNKDHVATFMYETNRITKRTGYPPVEYTKQPNKAKLIILDNRNSAFRI